MSALAGFGCHVIKGVHSIEGDYLEKRKGGVLEVK